MPSSKASDESPTSAPLVSPSNLSSVNQSSSFETGSTVSAGTDAFRIKATPYARKFAAENKIDLSVFYFCNII